MCNANAKKGNIPLKCQKWLSQKSREIREITKNHRNHEKSDKSWEIREITRNHRNQWDFQKSRKSSKISRNHGNQLGIWEIRNPYTILGSCLPLGPSSNIQHRFHSAIPNSNFTFDLQHQFKFSISYLCTDSYRKCFPSQNLHGLS